MYNQSDEPIVRVKTVPEYDFYPISEDDFINSQNPSILSNSELKFQPSDDERRGVPFARDLIAGKIKLTQGFDLDSIINDFCQNNSIDKAAFYKQNTRPTDDFISYLEKQLNELYGADTASSLIDFYTQGISDFGSHIINQFFLEKEKTVGFKYNSEIAMVMNETGGYYLSVKSNCTHYKDSGLSINCEYLGEPERKDFPGSYVYNVYPDDELACFRVDPSSFQASNKAFELIAKGDFSNSIEEMQQLTCLESRKINNLEAKFTYKKQLSSSQVFTACIGIMQSQDEYELVEMVYHKDDIPLLGVFKDGNGNLIIIARPSVDYVSGASISLELIQNAIQVITEDYSKDFDNIKYFIPVAENGRTNLGKKVNHFVTATIQEGELLIIDSMPKRGYDLTRAKNILTPLVNSISKTYHTKHQNPLTQNWQCGYYTINELFFFLNQFPVISEDTHKITQDTCKAISEYHDLGVRCICDHLPEHEYNDNFMENSEDIIDSLFDAETSPYFEFNPELKQYELNEYGLWLVNHDAETSALFTDNSRKNDGFLHRDYSKNKNCFAIPGFDTDYYECLENRQSKDDYLSEIYDFDFTKLDQTQIQNERLIFITPYYSTHQDDIQKNMMHHYNNDYRIYPAEQGIEIDVHGLLIKRTFVENKLGIVENNNEPVAALNYRLSFSNKDHPPQYTQISSNNPELLNVLLRRKHGFCFVNNDKILTENEKSNVEGHNTIGLYKNESDEYEICYFNPVSQSFEKESLLALDITLLNKLMPMVQSLARLADDNERYSVLSDQILDILSNYVNKKSDVAFKMLTRTKALFAQGIFEENLENLFSDWQASKINIFVSEPEDNEEDNPLNDAITTQIWGNGNSRSDVSLQQFIEAIETVYLDAGKQDLIPIFYQYQSSDLTQLRQLVTNNLQSEGTVYQDSDTPINLFARGGALISSVNEPIHGKDIKKNIYLNAELNYPLKRNEHDDRVNLTKMDLIYPAYIKTPSVTEAIMPKTMVGGAILGAIVGVAVGFLIGGPVGAAAGGTAGFFAGGQLGIAFSMLMSSAIRKIKGLPKSIIKSVDRKEGLTGESFTYSNAKQRLTEFDKDMKKQNSTLSSNSSDDEYSDEINDTDNKNLHVVSDKIIIETCNENDKVPSVNNDFQFKRFGSR